MIATTTAKCIERLAPGTMCAGECGSLTSTGSGRARGSLLRCRSRGSCSLAGYIEVSMRRKLHALQLLAALYIPELLPLSHRAALPRNSVSQFSSSGSAPPPLQAQIRRASAACSDIGARNAAEVALEELVEKWTSVVVCQSGFRTLPADFELVQDPNAQADRMRLWGRS